MTFPPTITYPLALDSDYTLFSVFNTSEAQLASDNLPWSQEIEIVPVGEDEAEIWANNGFANISGELFYYDSVEKDENDKIYKFKRCARNLGGKRTQSNKTGTWVRGFVIAEHHNQLVQAMINVEKFVGVNFSEDQTTLDYRIRHLLSEQTCDDDHSCPDVSFKFEVVEPSTDGCTGTTVEYDLRINGFFKSFKIDFGDGTSTTSVQLGQHTYPPSAEIDPIVTVTGDTCQIVQTAIERENPKEPEPSSDITEFEINVPEIQEFPTLVLPDINIPDTTLTFPQVSIPCGSPFDGISIGDITVPSIIVVEPPIPSFIDFGPLEIPSTISFIGVPSFPPISFSPVPISLVVFGPIDFGPVPPIGPIEFDDFPDVPSIDFGPLPPLGPILFGPAPTFSDIYINATSIPATITLTGTIPSQISIVGTIPSIISIVGTIPSRISLTGSVPSSISVNWGTPPPISVSPVSVILTCSGGSPMRAMNLDDNYIDSLMGQDVVAEVQDLGIPSEIKIIAPVMPEVRMVHNLPESIKVIAPQFADIQILGPAIPLPHEIKIVTNTQLPERIEIVSDLPKSIPIDASSIPNVIKLEMPDIMPKLMVDMPSELRVVGFPSSIPITGSFPSEIVVNANSMIEALEKIKIPMVYEGGPIPLVFEPRTPSGQDGETRPCFALVPCGT